MKRLRLAAGMSVANVAVIGSKSKIQSIENGVKPVKVADVWALCRLYDADAATTDRLAEMAVNVAKGGWWEEYSDVMPSWFSVYVELEAAATKASIFNVELVPGLLPGLRRTRELPGFR